MGAVVLFAPAAANAATFQVDNTGDGAPVGTCDAGTANDCNLREAITLANANAEDDVITFGPGVTGTIQLNQGELPVNSADALEIQGPGASALTVSADVNSTGVQAYRRRRGPDLGPDADQWGLRG